MDLRVQRDHPVAEDRRHAGELGDVGDRRCRRRRSPRPCRRSTRAPAEVVQAARELDDAGLVVHGQQARWARLERSHACRCAWPCHAIRTAMARCDEHGLRSRCRSTWTRPHSGGFCGFQQVQGSGLADDRRRRGDAHPRHVLDWTSVSIAGSAPSGDSAVRLLLHRRHRLDPRGRPSACSRSCSTGSASSRATQPWPLIFLGATGLAALLMILRILLGGRASTAARRRSRRRHVRRRRLDGHRARRCRS